MTAVLRVIQPRMRTQGGRRDGRLSCCWARSDGPACGDEGAVGMTGVVNECEGRAGCRRY